jgi:peptidoglycan/xylan/chitin deacetylase (PgdA/CDA1 family)
MLHTGGRVAAATRKAARLRRGVPVLMYHLVSDEVPPSFDGYTVTPSQFAAQVRALTRLGASSISPDELRVAHQDGRSLPPRPVVITFDDGFRDCLRHAAPLLHEAGLRATMYLVAGLLGRTSRWLAPEGLEHLPLISAAEARELEQAGIECQSHSFSHPRLADLRTADVTRELLQSRRVLEDELGHPVRHLAYPHGSYDPRVKAEAREAGYLTGYTTRPGKAMSYDDVLAVPRVKVDGRRGSADFMARLTTGRDARYPLRLLAGTSEG